ESEQLQIQLVRHAEIEDKDDGSTKRAQKGGQRRTLRHLETQRRSSASIAKIRTEGRELIPLNGNRPEADRFDGSAFRCNHDVVLDADGRSPILAPADLAAKAQFAVRTFGKADYNAAASPW